MPLSARGGLFLYGAPPRRARLPDPPAAGPPLRNFAGGVPGCPRYRPGIFGLWGKDVRKARRAEESGCPSGGMHTVLRGKSAAFPLFVLMAGERKQEGWGAGWHRHGATALPPSSIPLRSWRSLLQGADGGRVGRRCGASRPDPQLPAPQCKTAAWRARPAAAPVGTPSPFATVAADQPGTGETV